MEVSSRRPPKLQSHIAKKKPVSRDPRFDDLSGNYNEEQFKRSYRFIDRLKAKERKVTQKRKPVLGTPVERGLTSYLRHWNGGFNFANVFFKCASQKIDKNLIQYYNQM